MVPLAHAAVLARDRLLKNVDDYKGPGGGTTLVALKKWWHCSGAEGHSTVRSAAGGLQREGALNAGAPAPTATHDARVRIDRVDAPIRAFHKHLRD